MFYGGYHTSPVIYQDIPNMQTAIRKWKADRNWVLGIIASSEIPIGIKTIFTRD